MTSVVNRHRYSGVALLLVLDALERGDREAAAEWIWLDLDDEMPCRTMRPAPESLSVSEGGDAVLYSTVGEWGG